MIEPVTESANWQPKDWIAFGAAIVSVVSAIVSWAGASVTRRLAMGQAETALRAAIRATRESVRDIAIKIAEVKGGTADENYSEDQKAKLEILSHTFREATEDNLNSYEDACGKYLDKKIDRDRFKRMFYTEIVNLGQVQENSVIYSMMYPEQQSRFKAIWKVYHQWTNLET